MAASLSSGKWVNITGLAQQPGVGPVSEPGAFMNVNKTNVGYLFN